MQNKDTHFIFSINRRFDKYCPAAVFIVIAIAMVFFNTASAMGEKTEISNPLFDRYVLQDQNNQALPLSQYQGKTLLLNFIFTTCGAICPLQTRQLVEVQRQIPLEHRHTIRFLSLTVDPEHDTPEKLSAYAKTMGVDLTNWALATGTPEDIFAIAKQLRAFDPKKSSPSAGDHSNMLYLFDKKGMLIQRYSGDPVDVPRVAREIQQLDQLKSAAD
ncbi:MAG: SCO family protein [Methylococcales bacterium]|nr:SCO family protein [Methylococcales bacterium]